MQLRVNPSAWITPSGLSPAWTLSTARIRISSSVLWSRARASRRFMPHYTLCLLTYELVNRHVRLGVGDANLFGGGGHGHAQGLRRSLWPGARPAAVRGAGAGWFFFWLRRIWHS